MAITIWAKGEIKHMTVGGRPYSYAEDLGQQTFSLGWELGSAYKSMKEKYPHAKQFIIGESGDGGCVTGWEKDAMPGY